MSARVRFAALAAGLLLAIGRPAAAANVEAFAVYGVRLGDTIAAVQRAIPDTFADRIDYEDPQVGFAYEATLGRRVPARFEARGYQQVPGRSPTEFIFRFTGRERLFEAIVWERFDGPIDCGQRIAGWRTTFGAPDVQVATETVQWLQRGITVDRMLEIRCFAEGRVSWQLIDQRAEDEYLTSLRAQLRPYVEQVLLR